MNDIPIEVIKSIKILTDFVNERKYMAALVSQVGGLSLYTDNENYKYISPIALDMMAMNPEEINQ